MCLCAATRGILKQAKDLNPYSWEERGFIFPSATALRKPLSENTLNGALWRMGYKTTHTGHGFRSSADTILNERGIAREKVIDFQLAHFEENETKKAYNRAEYWDERVKLMRDWADIVAELRDGKPPRISETKRRREGAAQL
jgi:integrase